MTSIVINDMRAVGFAAHEWTYGTTLGLDANVGVGSRASSIQRPVGLIGCNMG